MILVVVLFVLAGALACFALGYCVSDSINEKRYWKRQNDMERLNRWL